MTADRIWLSPPDVDEVERRLLLDANDSNWIAPLGPHVDAFEREFAARIGIGHAVALSSGTAALHLALHVLGIEAGDEVVTSTLTFAATANAVTYVGARPVFVDVSASSWTLDPDLLAEFFAVRKRIGRLPRALLTVDLYGQCCDYSRIVSLCRDYGVVLIEDAAEGLGATCQGVNAGVFGRCAAFSFNGNKIITTSGGGMLVAADRALADRARHLSTQARLTAPHYEHAEVGFNYRMSNLLAAVGRGQLSKLDAYVERRRDLNQRYRAALGGSPGITFMPEAPYGRATFWLTCILIDPAAARFSRDDLRLAYEAVNIEARPVWKPMHLQRAFQGAECIGGMVAAGLFERGLCLPSGSSLTAAAQDRVLATLLEMPA